MALALSFHSPLWFENGFILSDLAHFWFWGVGIFCSYVSRGCRAVPACGSRCGSSRGRGWDWTAQNVRAMAGGHLWKESSRAWTLCGMKDMRHLRRHGLKRRMKKKMAIRARKGFSQGNQDQILALKPQNGRGRVVGEFCMADTALVCFSNSQ